MARQCKTGGTGAVPKRLISWGSMNGNLCTSYGWGNPLGVAWWKPIGKCLKLSGKSFCFFCTSGTHICRKTSHFGHNTLETKVFLFFHNQWARFETIWNDPGHVTGTRGATSYQPNGHVVGFCHHLLKPEPTRSMRLVHLILDEKPTTALIKVTLTWLSRWEKIRFWVNRNLSRAFLFWVEWYRWWKNSCTTWDVW